MSFKIEKGILMKEYSYPFKDMEVGDSFLVTSDNLDNTKAMKCRSYANTFIKDNKKDWKFSVKKRDEGFRCFRVK